MTEDEAFSHGAKTIDLILQRTELLAGSAAIAAFGGGGEAGASTAAGDRIAALREALRAVFREPRETIPTVLRSLLGAVDPRGDGTLKARSAHTLNEAKRKAFEDLKLAWEELRRAGWRME